jgi:hypothetical protein
MSDLGRFQEGFNSFRRMLAAVSEGSRLQIFVNAASEAATFVSKGLDRTLAADELTDMAAANGLDDADAVQWVIGNAFARVEERDRVPDPDPDPPPRTNGHAPEAQKQLPPPASATPYVFPDPASIPRREWLFGGHFVREAATATVAPGGFGKTTLTLYELITMAESGLRVWYISGEDPKLEIDRRIAAHCAHHGTDQLKVAQNLFVDDKTTFPLFIGQSPRTAVVNFNEQWLTAFERAIIDKQIDVVALDPFISFHAVPESDNGAIDQIVKRLALIAQRTKCCIELSHHVRKPGQGFQSELTTDDARGGSAIINAVRSGRVINRMNQSEAGVAKIAEDRRSAYVRVDKGKRNMAPAEAASWFHIVSVWLPNGDNVQAIERFEFPSAFAGMASDEIEWVQNLLREGGPKRASSQSDDWLGHDIGRHNGREDTDTKPGAIWANRVISEWLRNKVIKKVPLRDPISRKPNVPFYVAPDFKPDDDDNVVPLFNKSKRKDEE